MFSKKNLVTPAALILTSFLGMSAAYAQTTPCPYTLASLQGSYAVVVNYGANVALGLQPESLDGKGNLTRTGINNQPTAGSTTGQRTITNVTSTGTYTVNCNGTGTITRIVTRADGTTAAASDDFVITGAMAQNGQLIATTIVDAQRDPSVIVPGGIFVTRTHTLLPNGCYSQASLQGSYGVVVNYGANVALGLQPESLDGIGKLTRTGVLNQPTTGSTTGQRTVAPVTSTGTYTVNCNGTGTSTRIVTRADGTTAPASDDFIVTGAIVQNGQLIATTIVDAQRDPSVIIPGGIFVTRTHTMLPPPQSAAIPPPPPQTQTVAIAGPKNATVTSRDIQLDGTKSTSADGKPLTYLWTIAQGSPQAALLGGTTATPTVQFSQGRGTYTFQLTVTDSAGKSSTDFATVTYLGY
jgi:PKD domain